MFKRQETWAKGSIGIKADIANAMVNKLLEQCFNAKNNLLLTWIVGLSALYEGEKISLCLEGEDMKKVVVACGSGIATSTAVEAKVKDLLDSNGLAGTYNIVKCSIGEAVSQCADADILIATTEAPASITCPYVSGVPFLTTIGKAAAEQQILDILK